MFGISIKLECPHCNQEHMQNLGITNYYRINNSKNDYTKCRCYLCKELYWLSHICSDVIDVRKINENDELDKISTVCW